MPAGVAGLTDRVLPYSFPTATAATFDDVLAHSVLVEAPPPQESSTVATSFDALAGARARRVLLSGGDAAHAASS